MKRTLSVAKSVAKVFSPLILSFLTIVLAVWFLKANFGVYFNLLAMTMKDGEKAPATQARNILEPYKGPTRDTVDGSEIVYPRRGDLYARLAIPSCGIEDDVYFSDDEASLNKGLGQYYATRIPGYGSPILISGHNNHSFHTLGDAKAGDIVTITTSYGVYEYRITRTEILEASKFDQDVLYQDGETLIMYTCYPFTAMTLTRQRFFVYAEKISGPVVLH